MEVLLSEGSDHGAVPPDPSLPELRAHFSANAPLYTRA